MAIGRSAESTANTTAANQNSGYYNNAQNSYTNAQADEGDFENQLGAYNSNVAGFAGANPYKTGGEDQTSTNQVLSNTAGASAASAGEALQAQALRTGQNPNAAVSATEQMQEQNERNLSGQEAQATQSRISNEAGYNQNALAAEQGLLQDTAQPVGAETSLSGQQAQAAQGSLGQSIQAGETPTFLDEFGNAFGQSLGKTLGGGNGGAQIAAKAIGCWIAAELYGGWDDPRTDTVRQWIFGTFASSGIIPLLLAKGYMRYGERTAAAIHRWPILRRVFLPLFNRALKKAQGV